MRVAQGGAVAWAVVGCTVAVASLASVNEDARFVVGIASVLFPLAAVLAAVALGRVSTAWPAPC